MAAGFPLAVRLTHFFDFAFLSLLVRSGIEILGAHPKLYWNDHCTPGTEWFGSQRKPLSSEQPVASDEVKPRSSWVALPGHDRLGLGLHWHFFSVVGWLTCGVLYVVTMFATSEWRRVIPTSWSIFPQAAQAMWTYMTFHIPHTASTASPFNPLQQLIYFLLVFGLAPLLIVSGLAMSPALSGRFPRLSRILGGRQGARSVHFLGLVAFIAFFVIHMTMVIAHGFAEEMAKIVLGGEDQAQGAAVVVGLSGIAAVVGLNVIATRMSHRSPALTKRLLEVGIDPLKRLLFHHMSSQQNYDKVSPRARINGRPPKNEVYTRAATSGFIDWRLVIDGLVEQPMSLSLADLRKMSPSSQSTLHACIQGWSYFASWTGVPIADLLDAARPSSEARYLVFHTLDEKWEVPGHGNFYEVIDLETARRPQVILAYEMNGAPLPIAHGAPLRLRVEHQLGYKMAKWVTRIELVADFRGIGKGQGGWRDDLLDYYPSDAGI